MRDPHFANRPPPLSCSPGRPPPSSHPRDVAACGWQECSIVGQPTSTATRAGLMRILCRWRAQTLTELPYDCMIQQSGVIDDIWISRRSSAGRGECQPSFGSGHQRLRRTAPAPRMAGGRLCTGGREPGTNPRVMSGTHRETAVHNRAAAGCADTRKGSITRFLNTGSFRGALQPAALCLLLAR